MEHLAEAEIPFPLEKYEDESIKSGQGKTGQLGVGLTFPLSWITCGFLLLSSLPLQNY